MYLVFRHDDSFVGEYETMEDFALSKFVIDISDSGVITIGDEIYPTSYNIEEFTEDEIIKDFIQSNFFKECLRSIGYSVYSATKII